MNTSTPLPKLALIAGPTASGKSALALALAELTGGVIVNADASQVYRDLRVVTARPTPEDEARADHRLYGIADAGEDWSAARWAAAARATIDAVHAEGRLPILTGGTGLYIRTLIDGIAPVPTIDPAIRAAVRALPVADAYAALRQEDVAGAMRLNPGDTARVARALEVVRATGRPIAAWQAAREGGMGACVEIAPLILLPDRDALFDRCDARLEAMFEEGAVEEVAALVARDDVAETAPARRAIGVAEIAAMLSGDLSPADALTAARGATRRYAKRQYTWFRHQPPRAWPRVDDLPIDRLKYYFNIWP